MAKRIIIILLVVSLITYIVAGCTETKTEHKTENDQNYDSGGENTIVTTERLQADLPDGIDFKGDTFTFIGTGPDAMGGYYVVDVCAEKQNGDTINDALYIRNRSVEEKLNINISEYKSGNVSQDVSKSISAGDNAYDAILGPSFLMTGLAQTGFLMDIKEIPYIDLDKPWWDKNAENELSIINKLFFTAGDIDIMVKACTRLLIFNKKLTQEYDVGDPYEHVRNDTWTFDVYAKMVKSMYTDVNGNGELDDADIYGTIMEYHNVLAFVMGFGNRLTTKNSDGIPEAVFNDSIVDAANKVWDLYYDETACRDVGVMKKTDNFIHGTTYARSLFANDKFLFHLGAMGAIEELRNMGSDFGLLPMPKLSSSQSRYYHPMVGDAYMAMLCVPVTADLEKTGIVLEAMAAESMYTLTPAYNEILLKRKYIRDEESEFVIEILNKTRMYDLGLLFLEWRSWGAVMSDQTIARSRNLASEFEKTYNKTQAAIDKTVNAFKDQ